MIEIVFDLETDGFLSKVSTVHCITTECNGELRAYHDAEGLEPCHGTIAEGLQVLAQADRLIGHNIKGYDLKVLAKLYPDWEWDGEVYDTLIMSRLVWPDIQSIDREKDPEVFPRKLIGKHSLEAWGRRLGDLKGDFKGPWDEFTQEMLTYGVQDTAVTAKLYALIQSKDWPEQSRKLEHAFAECLETMMETGVYFKVGEARELEATLNIEIARVDDELANSFEPRVIEYVTPKKQLKRTREVVFNPNSRQQIAWHLKNKYGWLPDTFTPTGHPKVDEKILLKLNYPEARKLAERLSLRKTLGMVAEGKSAWLKKVGEDSRIHGRINHNGAVSGRCTHSAPNLGQVPSVRAPYGRECRALFGPTPGRKFVGCDAGKLELVCLAHYLHPFDGGAYAEIVSTGDAHAENQKAAGLATRDQAKTFVYALIYGAGDAKMGSIVGKGRKAGKQLKRTFYRNNPAFLKLQDWIDEELKRNNDNLRGLDGRWLPVRSRHSALNVLLQGAGAVIMKQATVLANAETSWAGPHRDMVLHVHDEVQFETDEDDAEALGELLESCITQAAEVLGLKCPLGAESKIGDNWMETH